MYTGPRRRRIVMEKFVVIIIIVLLLLSFAAPSRIFRSDIVHIGNLAPGKSGRRGFIGTSRVLRYTTYIPAACKKICKKMY